MPGTKLVISLVSGYTYFHIKAFVESIRSHSPSADICLLVHESTDKQTLTQLASRNVLLHPFTFRWPVSPLLSDPSDREMASSCNIFFLRHLLFRAFIASNASKYSHIFIADARDVVSQRDIFSHPFVGPLQFFAEPRSIRECALNSEWIRSQFGVGSLARIESRPILCAGTTIGETQAILRYLSCLIDTTKRLNRPVMDQGVHNFIIYNDLLTDEYRIHDNDCGPICTMHHGSDYKIESGMLVNSQGVPYCVLHQYDRHRPMAILVRRRIFGSDVTFHFQRLRSKIINAGSRRRAQTIEKRECTPLSSR